MTFLLAAESGHTTGQTLFVRLRRLQQQRLGRSLTGSVGLGISPTKSAVVTQLIVTNMDDNVALWQAWATMPKRSSKPKSQDVNQIAAGILRTLTGEAEKQPEKNPAAVALGRLGGLKGGKARAEALTPAKRAEIARKAARKRWGKSK